MIRSDDADVLVVGGGLAGLRAALASAAKGANTVLVSKTAPGRGCNSVLAGGGFSLAAPGFTMEDHVAATLKAGKHLNDPDLVAALAANAPKEIELLQSAGVPMHPHKNGYRVRASSDRLPPGRVCMRKLARMVLGHGKIRVIPHAFVARLLVEENTARGVVALGRDGSIWTIRSKATILATGGAGALFARNDNAAGATGDGYALASEAGLPLHHMEFIQFYPLAFAETGLANAIVFPPVPAEARMVDAEGRDILKKHGVDADLNGFALVSSRDRASHIVYKESSEKGVWLDYTGVPDSTWTRHPLTLFPVRKFDFRQRPFRIAPVAHFFMGGIRITPHGETAVRALFAAGEVASGLHGANRLGGNALAECLVFGAKAGLAAADYAGGSTSRPTTFRTGSWVASQLSGRADGFAKRRAASLLGIIRDVAWRCAGPVRNEGMMRKGLSRLNEVEDSLERITAGDIAALTAKKQAAIGVVVLRAVLNASLARRESIGAFQRDD